MEVNKGYLSCILQYGAGEPITSKGLATTCDSTDRDIRLTIRELIADGIPIAASTDGRNGGYFIANTTEEAKDYIGQLRHRIIQDCLRFRDFKIAARPLFIPGQLLIL